MDVKELSEKIAIESVFEAEFHPIDRNFLTPYLKEIVELDKNEFILYNFERSNSLYTVHLMLCLPEVWEETNVDDLIYISTRFTNVLSFFDLIQFTYKFIEINIIELILGLGLYTTEIKEFLKRQYNVLLKEDWDMFIIEEDIIGIDYNQWMYIKQKFLLDKRVSPAFPSAEELKDYVFSL